MDKKNQPLLSLHKYWIQANRMREDLIKEMEKLPADADIEDLYQYCLRTNNIALHTFRYFWLASLCTVIEGYKKLQLNDNKINNLISNSLKNIEDLRKFRNSTRHFELPSQRNKKIKDLKISMKWISELHAAFGEYLFNKVTELTTKQNV